MTKSTSKLTVTITGSQSQKDVNNVRKGLTGLINAFAAPEKVKFKFKRTIFCNDCKGIFKTFKALKSHMKKTGHTDKPDKQNQGSLDSEKNGTQ